MMPSEIARSLRGRRMGRGKWMARCPSHRERTASLSITDMGGGKTRLHCFAGCSQADVLIAAGLTWKDLSPHNDYDPAKWRARQLAAEHKENEKRRMIHILQNRLRHWELLAAQQKLPENSDKFHFALREARFWCERLNQALKHAYGTRYRTETM